MIVRNSGEICYLIEFVNPDVMSKGTYLDKIKSYFKSNCEMIIKML